MKKIETKRFCRHPDRDVPELICGYPLPCPWHTVTINVGTDPPTVTIPVTAQKAMNPNVVRGLKLITMALSEREAHHADD